MIVTSGLNGPGNRNLVALVWDFGSGIWMPALWVRGGVPGGQCEIFVGTFVEILVCLFDVLNLPGLERD